MSFTYNGINYYQYSTSSGDVAQCEGNQSYNGNGSVFIPKSVMNGSTQLDVVAISANCFNSNTVITNLSFASDSVCTAIGSDAFYGCSNLTTISLPNSLITIYIESFSFCNLTNITIPPNVTNILYNAFVNNNNLNNVYFLGNYTQPDAVPSNMTGFNAESFNISTSTPYVGNGYFPLGNATWSGISPNNDIYLASLQAEAGPIVCFKENSKILTDKGYKYVQNLRKGDSVKTSKNGFKKIDMIGKRTMYHPATNERIKDQLYKCSKSIYPEVFEDLVITGCHSILIDDFTSQEQREKSLKINGDIYVTDDKYRIPACVDERASVYETPGNYTIYHFALENDDIYMNYGVYANGLLVETCSKRFLKECSKMDLI